MSAAPAAVPPVAGPEPAARHRALWIALALAAPAAWVLRGALAGGVLFRRDVHLVWHPQVEAFVRAIAAGSWPVWDPGPAFGQPLLADPSAMVLYPFTWLNLVLRPWTYYTVFAAAHLVFSAAGARLLARRLGASGPAALLTALLWALSGPFLSLLDLWHHFASAAWMPWVLLAALRAAERPQLGRGLGWGAAMGAQILAGSADMCAMTGLVALALAARQARRTPAAGAHHRRLAGTAALAGAFALALSAGLWMSALDVASASERAGLRGPVRTYWSVHPLSLLETITPALWSASPLRSDWSVALFEGREPFLASVYLGLPALALAAAAFTGRGQRGRGVLAAAAAIGVLVALGRHAPFYGALVAALPPLQILRYPVKVMVPVALACAVLAGFGWDAWERTDEAGRARRLGLVVAPVALVGLLSLGGAIAAVTWPDAARAALFPPEVSEAGARAALRAGAARLAVTAVLAALTVLAALVAVRRPARAAVTAGLVGALAVADLALVHRRVQPVAPQALYTHRPAVVDALARVPHQRVYAYDYTRPEARARLQRDASGPLARAPEGWPLEAAQALAMQMHLAPATAGRWAIRTGYDLDYRGLFPHDLGQLTLLLRTLEGTPAHTRLLRAAGISHVVSLHAAGLDNLREVGAWDGLYREPTRLFEVPDPQPRAYVVASARVARGAEAIRQLAEGSDASTGDGILVDSGPAAAAPAGFAGTARVVEEMPDRVRLEATLGAPGYVVLLDGFAPGWRASVDGRPAPLIRANVAFRAVPLPAGTHRVELVYRPPAMVAGLWLSAAAAAAGAAVALGQARRALRAGA